MPSASRTGSDHKLKSDAAYRAVKKALGEIEYEDYDFRYCTEDRTFIWRRNDGPFSRDDDGSHFLSLLIAKSDRRIGGLAVDHVKEYWRASHINAAEKQRWLAGEKAPPPKRSRRLQGARAPYTIPEPEILFPAKVFVFTGIFEFGGHNCCEEVTAQRGGTVGKDVSSRTNYLVVGKLGSPDWKWGNVGLKVKAVDDSSRRVQGVLMAYELTVGG